MNVWQRRDLKRAGCSVLFRVRPQRFGDDRTASFDDAGKFKGLRLPERRTRCAAFRARTFRLRYEPKANVVRALPWSTRSYADAVIIRSPLRDMAALRPFVEDAIARGLLLFAAVGSDSGRVEVEIDRIMVGDRFDVRRSRLTTAHDTLVDALFFIRAMHDRKRFFEVWL